MVFGFLLPGSEDKTFSWGQPLMFAEVATMLWLLIRGARDESNAYGTAG
jgi:hypothetical protein